MSFRRRRRRWSRRCASSERATTRSPERVAVEPVDDARALGLLAALDLAGEQPVDDRAVRVAGRRVDDDAGRLVHDQQVLVLVGDAQALDRLRLEDALPALGQLEVELLAARQPVALRSHGTVHEHGPEPEQALGLGPGADTLTGREEAVEPLAGRLGRHDQLQRCHPVVLGAVRRRRGWRSDGDERGEQDA